MLVFACVSFLLLQISRISGTAATEFSTLTVDAPFGKIKGNVVTDGDSKDDSYVHFSNIPYARAPVGELRFAKPLPHPRIDGTFDATSKREVRCPFPDAMLAGLEQGHEDCLILNIFAKNVQPGKLKKVMVFIHGGGFVVGWSSSHNMSSFVKNHDVIGVTVNYRLGILGFLSTGNEASPGNYALWDQALALQWVKDNIEAFGGDPDDVTLSGESAGGTSVALQALSPVTKGLFSKACPQSGAVTSVFGQAVDVQKHALEVAKHVKCWNGEVTDQLDLKQSNDVIKCLRGVDTAEFTSFMYYTLTEARFVPSVDGEFIPKKTSLLLQDDSYLDSIGFYDRSYLLSVVYNEFAIMRSFYDNVNKAIASNDKLTEDEKKGAIAKHAEDIRDYYLRSTLGSDASNSELVDKITSFYDRRNVGDDAVIDMVTDHSFLIPTYEFLNAASKRQKSKLWFLFFNYFPGFMKGKFKGTAHGVDLMYWHDFSVEMMESFLQAGMEGEMDDGDIRLKSMFSSLLVEFMKTGDPNGALSEHLPTPLPQYDPDTSHYLNFDLEPTVRSHLGREKRDMWLKSVPRWKKKDHQHTEL